MGGEPAKWGEVGGKGGERSEEKPLGGRGCGGEREVQRNEKEGLD